MTRVAAVRGRARASPKRRPWRAWQAVLALVLLSTALKLLVVLAPSAYLSPGWVLPEEQHRGNVAVEILQGPMLPLLDFHHSPNVGGSVVVGALAAPFVALFGPSILAVRLVPILFNALVVLLVFCVLDKSYGRRAAWIGGLLMAVAAPGYTLVSVTAWGTHHENNALTMACLLLALGLHRRANGNASGVSASGPSLVRAALLGLAAGFAVYFGYMVLIALATLLVFELLQDKLFFARRWFAAFVAGLAVGFAPWLVYNLEHDFEGLTIYREPLLDRVDAGGIAGFFDHVAYLVTDFAPASFFFRELPVLGTRLTEWLVYAAFAVLAGAALVRLRAPIAFAARGLVRLRGPRAAPPSLCFLLYLPAFAIAFSLFDVGQWDKMTGIAHDGRYLAPLYPFLVLSAAVGCDALAGRGGIAKRFALTLVGGIVLLCGAGTLAVCDFSRFGATLDQPGTSTTELARFVTWKYRDDVDRLDRIFSTLEARGNMAIEDEVAFTLSVGIRSSLRGSDLATANGRTDYRRYAFALQHMHARIPSRFKPYFEDLGPHDRIYGFHEREDFWREYRRRKLAERELQAGTIPQR